MNILKQSVGIDVSMDSLEVRYGTTDTDQNQLISQSKTFKNNPAGHKRLLDWAIKNKVSKTLRLYFVMEATGVYYEKLAYFLVQNNQTVSVILPNKIKNYAKSLESKSKTDPIDSAAITRFALERKLTPWFPPEPFIKELKSLSREYHTLKVMATEVKNQIHAKQSAFDNYKEISKRKKHLVRFLEKQIGQILQQIKSLIKTIPSLNEKIERVSTIKGVGFITVVTILAETNLFEHVTNIKQLTSYAGLDVVLNDSGKRKGKTSISKKGNRFIRKALFMPALSACKHNINLKEYYRRLVSKGKNKKAALIAVARKLLLLIYTLWKNDSEYITDYKPCLHN